MIWYKRGHKTHLRLADASFDVVVMKDRQNRSGGHHAEKQTRERKKLAFIYIHSLTRRADLHWIDYYHFRHIDGTLADIINYAWFISVF